MFLLRGYEKRYFVIKAKRYRCPHCGRVFREPIEGLKAWQRSSIDLRKHMAARYRQGVCNKNIAKEFKVSESTVERIIHERYEAKVKELLHYSAPLVIGIDEHKIHKRRFATTIVDLKNHRVYDIIEGKSETSIGARIRSYPGRMQVKVVCMDLSSPYRSLVQRCFPNAKIVADRFHVIKLVLSTFMEFCREMQPEIRWKRHITGSLRTHNANLTSVQRATLKTFLAANPIIESAYDFKEKLCKLLNNKKKTKIQCIPLIRELQKCMDQMRTEATRHFHTLADTLSKWFEPIIRMWRFSKNNGITEGFHRKIKGIQRRGYGYRNFQNYKLRVLVECSHSR
jgi:transposase